MAVTMHKVFWISDVFSRLAGGLLTAWLIKRLDGYVCTSIASFMAAIGFGFIFLVQYYGGVWFYASSIFLGSAVGMTWVLVPQIILKDVGTAYFESLWGLTLTVNVCGMFVFDTFFMWVTGKHGVNEKSDCEGPKCYLLIFSISAIGWTIAGILALFGYFTSAKFKGKIYTFNYSIGTHQHTGEQQPLGPNEDSAKVADNEAQPNANSKIDLMSSSSKDKRNSKRSKSENKNRVKFTSDTKPGDEPFPELKSNKKKKDKKDKTDRESKSKKKKRSKSKSKEKKKDKNRISRNTETSAKIKFE